MYCLSLGHQTLAITLTFRYTDRRRRTAPTWLRKEPHVPSREIIERKTRRVNTIHDMSDFLGCLRPKHPVDNTKTNCYCPFCRTPGSQMYDTILIVQRIWWNFVFLFVRGVFIGLKGGHVLGSGFRRAFEW